MRIRRAGPEDAGAICAVANPFVHDTLVTFTTEERVPEAVARALESGATICLLAEEGDEAIGFASFSGFRNGPGYAATKEHTILLSPRGRRRGIGRALMAALEDEARGQGVHVLVAGISSANPDGIAFHRALGFREVGRMPQVGRKFGQWLDLVLMQKIL
jgi:phosphinothricin acetyltransferase